MYTPSTTHDKVHQVENGLRRARSGANGHPTGLRLADRMAHHRVPGASIAVVDRAALDWARGYGVLAAGAAEPVRPDSLFHACSMSKFVTALAALRLVARGVLDLDEDVNRTLKGWQVPENALTRAHPVTLRRLLTHQSGIVDPEGSFGPLRAGEEMPAAVDVLAGRTRFHPGPVEVTVEAGCDFNYSDAGFCVVEQLLIDATGKRFDALVQELVFGPAGMTRSLFQRDASLGGAQNAACGHDARGQVIPGERAVRPCRAAAGLWSTPGDLAQLLVGLMHSLEGRGTLLPHDLAWEMITPHGCVDWAGLGVFVAQPCQERSLFTQGCGLGFQCVLAAFPLLGMGAVVMTNSDPGQPQSRALTGEIMRGIGHAYGWPDAAG